MRRAGDVLAGSVSGITKVAQVARARWALRACDRVGAWSRAMWGSPIVENQGFIDVGPRTRFLCEFAPVELRTAPGGRLVIGERAGINYGTSFQAVESITIGRNVDIGPHCVVSDADTGSVDHPDRATVAPVVIGDDVWLASRVTVLPGSTIGAGAVITAGSVVDGDIPPNVIAGGIPARVLRLLDAAPDRAADSEPVNPTSAPASAPTPPVAPTRNVAPISGRGLLISDFTIDPLARALERPTAAVRVHAEVAPYDTVAQTLLAPPPEDTDFAVVWSRPEAILPSFARLLAGDEVGKDDILDDVDRFAGLVERGSSGFGCVIVPTWTVSPWLAGGGLTEGRPGGVTWALNLANNRLMDAAGGLSKVFVLDAQRWLSAAPSDAYSERMWFMGKVPFDERVFEAAADDVTAAVTAVRGGARKLVIVDLDNTLWGGVVGDDGWESLRLGGHDSDGEAFVEFQRALQQLTRRGVLLAIVSKNDEAVALEAINRHDGMVLVLDDFAAWRINWNDKAANIAALVADLNLGLQSVVFIDDNPHERARVAEALPEVLVPEWPDDPTSYPRALRALSCFDNPVRSAEDVSRTQLYATERRRTELLSSVASLDDWIRELDIVVRADALGPGNLPRASQLLNKTNQMNLTTRRLNEGELVTWASDPGHATWCVTVADRLGDAGLTGLVSVAVDGDEARLVDFVLSCRVMGRRVEPAMVHLACGLAREMGARRLVATLLRTAKNDPCRRFFDESGLTHSTDDVYEWDLTKDYPPPRDLVIASPTVASTRGDG